jgi:hypothetical protein
LIIILSDLQVHSEGIPSDATPLSRFSVFCHWHKSSDDEGKTFEQKVAMGYADENPILENIVAFQMIARGHRTVTNFNKFPALKDGEYNLTLSVRLQGETEWPKPIASYPINVTLIPAKNTVN